MVGAYSPRQSAERGPAARSRQPAGWATYGVAVLSVIAAAALRGALEPVIGTRYPFVTMFAAVAAAACYGGAGPGLLAVTLGGVATWFLFIPPRYSLAIPDAATLPGLGAYLLTASGIALLGGARHRARLRARLRAEAAARETTAQGERLREEIAARERAEEAEAAREERYRTPADQVKD